MTEVEKIKKELEMNYIILDLEATCWQDKGNLQSEIIEIGAVKVNGNFEIESEFSYFIKPKINPKLSDFCIELTTINQQNIDAANNFSNVIEKFKNWIDISNPYLLCSWGLYDKNQLISDCELHNLDFDWVMRHISLKHQYPNFKGLKRMVGMNGALTIENLHLDGTHHRGIDDARNITKIFLKNKEQWKLK